MDFRDFEALTFDCYGTLIDWECGILDVLRPWSQRHGLSVTEDDLLTTFADSEARHERATPGKAYPQILQAVFQDIAKRFGVEAATEDARVFARSIRHWPAFDDSSPALRYFRQHYKLAIISNVDRASFAFSQAELGVEFDAVITAQDVGSYKPDLRNFRYALDSLKALGVGPDRIVHIAQSLYHDHEPAKKLGLRTVWVNRRAGRSGRGATRPPRSAVQPDLVMNDLAALVAAHRAC